MEIRKSVTQKVDITVDYVCNRCAKSLKLEGDGFNGLIEAEVYGCYSSTYLTDLTIYKFSLCEKCLAKLFSEFKISPET